MSDATRWEDLYAQTRPENLPWNAGGPDPDLVRRVTSGRIPKGQALDLGAGAGHDAVFLIEHGFDVIGVDISPTAVKLARQNASDHGLFAFFQTADIRRLPIEDAYVDFVNDRGCFHVLPEADRPSAVQEISRVLKRKGLFLLRAFSEKEPGTDGPHRFSRPALEGLFGPFFHVLDGWEGVFEGSRKAKSISLLMERK
jgi:SAM-dependent methyltransferase